MDQDFISLFLRSTDLQLVTDCVQSISLWRKQLYQAILHLWMSVNGDYLVAHRIPVSNLNLYWHLLILNRHGQILTIRGYFDCRHRFNHFPVMGLSHKAG